MWEPLCTRSRLFGGVHKVRIYKEYHNVCPLVGNRTLPAPLTPANVPLPPDPGGGHTRQGARGWGSPTSDDLRKSLALYLLCGGVWQYICPCIIRCCVGTLPVVQPRINEGWERYGVGWGEWWGGLIKHWTFVWIFCRTFILLWHLMSFLLILIIR
jgi:hypothetical protein